MGAKKKNDQQKISKNKKVLESIDENDDDYWLDE